MNKDLLQETKNKIQQNGWNRLLLAVSGGLDSICLAHFFVTHKESLEIEWLGIVHVHHGLRAGTADMDAELVQQFAETHNVPFFLKKLDGEALKEAEGSLENNARAARYKALQEVIETVKGAPGSVAGVTAQSATAAHETAIVTAHHAGDQAETLYMRLRRGVTLAGLSGIRPVREGIFRPFLGVTRQEFQNYAQEHDLKWREDESNSDTKFARNLIRHQLLPHLEEENPGASEQLGRIAEKSARAYEKIMAIADKLFCPMVVSREKGLTLDTKKAKIPLTNGMDEIFRLWLDKQGYRFPVGTFKGKALLNDIRNLSYRTRFIAKNRNIIRICDQKTTTDI